MIMECGDKLSTSQGDVSVIFLKNGKYFDVCVLEWQLEDTNQSKGYKED